MEGTELQVQWYNSDDLDDIDETISNEDEFPPGDNDLTPTRNASESKILEYQAPTMAPRKSTRKIRKPPHLDDYQIEIK